MESPRLLPRIIGQGANEPAALYGARILCWLLGEGVIATLSDAEVELAEYAGAIASTTRGYLPVTYDRLNQIRHELAASTARRRAYAATCAAMAGAPDEKPNLGPMARLTPVQPVYPPSGAVAEIEGRYDRVQF